MAMAMFAINVAYSGCFTASLIESGVLKLGGKKGGGGGGGGGETTGAGGAELAVSLRTGEKEGIDTWSEVAEPDAWEETSDP